jgi:hypothetical protein
LGSLRAAWWTKRLLNFYEGPLYDATHLYDQSSAGKDLLSAAPIGTAADGADTALAFDPLVPNTFARGDALGLAADPALTLVWKMKCTADLTTFPMLLDLGTSGSSELTLGFQTGAINIGTFDGSGFIEAMVDGLDVWNTWVLTKPAGSGYNGAWRLYKGAVDQGAPAVISAGAMALGNTGSILGDFDGGGYPFGGHLAGMLVFERVLTGTDLAVVQSL